MADYAVLTGTLTTIEVADARVSSSSPEWSNEGIDALASLPPGMLWLLPMSVRSVDEQATIDTLTMGGRQQFLQLANK